MSRCDLWAGACLTRGQIWAHSYLAGMGPRCRIVHGSKRDSEALDAERLPIGWQCFRRLDTSAFVWLNKGYHVLVYPVGPDPLLVGTQGCALEPSHEVWLYLDDERPCPPGWTLAKTAAEAIEVLSTGRVTDVSLDHDLGPAEAGTGYDVICWLEEKAHTDPSFKVPSIEIHTANPSARVKMAAALGSIRRAPCSP